MGKRKLIILSVMLAVLFAAAFVKQTADQRRERALRAEDHTVELNKDLAWAFVSKVSIFESSPEPSLVVTKTRTGAWILENRYHAPARKDQVEYVLKTLTGIRGEPRSNSREVLNDYQLADGQGVRVLLEGADNKKLADTLISFKRGSGTQNFVRDAGSAMVLTTDTDMLGTLGIYDKDSKLDLKRFTELKISNFDTAAVGRFELNQSGAAPMRFTKEEDAKTKAVTWKMDPAPKSGESDPEKVKNFLNGMANIYAADLQDPAGSGYGFDKPWFRAEWGPADKLENIEIYLGAVSDKVKNKQYIKATPSNQIYDIFTANIEHLLKRDQASFLSAGADPSSGGKSKPEA